MKEFLTRPIGRVINKGEGTWIKLEPEYIPALQALDGFSHLNVIWWFSDFDNTLARATLQTPQPYKKAPGTVGIFATRSPIRPNPLALSVVQPISIDDEHGIIRVAYIDANDNSPVLDIKPYTPSLDRVESPTVPQWCSHWPDSIEKSAYFDWANEFNF